MKYVLTLLLLFIVAVGVYHHRDTLVSLFIRHVDLIDEPAPEYFFVSDMNGTQHELGEVRGKKTVLVLWATWCDGCLKTMKTLEDIQREYDGKVTIVTMNVDVVQGTSDARDRTTRSLDEVRDFSNQNNIVFPVWLLKGKGTEHWIKATENRLSGAEIKMPQFYILDKDMRVKWFAIAPYTGEIRAAVQQVVDSN